MIGLLISLVEMMDQQATNHHKYWEMAVMFINFLGKTHEKQPPWLREKFLQRMGWTRVRSTSTWNAMQRWPFPGKLMSFLVLIGQELLADRDLDKWGLEGTCSPFGIPYWKDGRRITVVWPQDSIRIRGIFFG